MAVLSLLLRQVVETVAGFLPLSVPLSSASLCVVGPAEGAAPQGQPGPRSAAPLCIVGASLHCVLVVLFV